MSKYMNVVYLRVGGSIVGRVHTNDSGDHIEVRDLAGRQSCHVQLDQGDWITNDSDEVGNGDQVRLTYVGQPNCYRITVIAKAAVMARIDRTNRTRQRYQQSHRPLERRGNGHLQPMLH